MIELKRLYTTAGLLLVLVAMALFSPRSEAITEVPVDVELQLLLDVSGSVNNTEYQLQLDGYASAFDSSELQETILSGDLGKIAVQLIMWSGADNQQVVIDWTLVDSPSSASSLAQSIATISRPFSGWTGIGSAIEYSYPLFASNGFVGTRNVVDVSGDGTNNSGVLPSAASAEALASGVDTINGIVITTNQRVIDEYVDNVVGGDNAFVMVTDNYVDFEDALALKLANEVQGTVPKEAIAVPEPGTLALFSTLALFIFRRQTRKA